MNQKTTIGLVAALGVAIIGLWWAQSSSVKDGPRTTPGPKALIDPALGEMKEIEITPAQGAAPVRFVKQDDKWRMTAPVEGPADQSAVTADANRIKDLKYTRSFPKDDPERPTDAMTSLGNPLKVVALTDQAGRKMVVKIGSRQALSSGTYVQTGGDETIYLSESDLHAEMKRGLDDYRGKRVTEFAMNDATRIEVSGEQQYTLTRNNDQWTLDSPIKGRADKPAVNRLLSAASNLTALKYVDDDPKNLRPYGLEPPRLEVAVHTETKTPKAPPEPPASAPAEPQFDIRQHVYKIALGGTADDKVFARLIEPAVNSVFQLASASMKDLSPALEDLRDKSIVDLQARQPQSITYTSQGQTIKLIKGATQQWEVASDSPVVPGRPAEAIAVSDLIKALRDLKALGFESVETPAQGFSSPRARIELMIEGQLEPTRLLVGGLTPSKTGAYVKNESDGTIAVVDSKPADDLTVGVMSFLGRELLTFARERASALEIRKSGVTLQLAEQDGVWKLTSPVQGPAEESKVNDVLANLAALRGRKVVGMASEAAKFGLDKPAMTVVVSVEAPPPPPSTQPASEPPPPTRHTIMLVQKDGLTYAMVQGVDKICEVDAKVYEDLDAEVLKTSIALFEPSQITRLSMSGEANFTLEKVGENWKLSGEESFAVDPVKITEFLTAIKDMKARKYVVYSGADLARFGINQPERTIVWKTESGEPTTLKISSKGAVAGEAHASISTAPDRVFLLKIDDVLKLRKKVQDFQKQGG